MVGNGIYKKEDTEKYKFLNKLAIEYLKVNHIKFTKCAWAGMAANVDIVKANGRYYTFEKKKKKEVIY